MNGDFDFGELDKLAEHLGSVQTRIIPAVRGAVSKGAVNIKTDAKARVDDQRVGQYLKHYSRSITYDLDESGTSVMAEIGPETARVQGAFGPGVEYGSARSAPLPHLNPALDAEGPKFVKAIGDVAVRAIS